MELFCIMIMLDVIQLQRPLKRFRNKFQLLSHPAHSSDLIPSDYYILGPLKDALHGRRFSNDEEVKDTVHGALRATENILRRWRQEARGPK